MLEAILQNLRDVDGVQGAMIVDHTATVIARRAHSIYDVTVLQQVARSIINAVDSVHLIQDDWDVLTTHFGEGKLVLRSLRTSGAKPRRYVLSVIADSTLNVAFLGVALRVAAAKLIAELEAGPAPPAQTTTAATVASSGAPARSPVSEPSRPDLAPAGLSWSGDSTAASLAGSGVTALDGASSAFLSACTRALAASIGPMAKVYVRDAVRRLCAGRAFSRADGPALLAQVSAMLDSAEDRAMFQRATRTL